MKKNNTHTFEFKYEGEFSSLDTSVVLNSQLQFINILKEIKDVQFPELELNMRIKGVEKGSLDINHVIEIVSVTGLYVLDNYEYFKTLFEILKDLFKLKLFLKDKKADSVTEHQNNVVNVYLNGNNIHVHSGAFNIYQGNPQVTNAFSNTGKLLQESGDIDYIQVKEKGNRNKLIKVERDDYPNLNQPNPYLVKSISEQVFKKQILFIKKPNLYPEKKRKCIWELLHRGRDIKAAIMDKAFMRQIDDGLKVGKGDRLEADLKIFMKYDEKLCTYVETQRFEVVNVIRVIGRTTETKFDFLYPES